MEKTMFAFMSIVTLVTVLIDSSFINDMINAIKELSQMW